MAQKLLHLQYDFLDVQLFIFNGHMSHILCCICFCICLFQLLASCEVACIKYTLCIYHQNFNMYERHTSTYIAKFGI